MGICSAKQAPAAPTAAAASAQAAHRQGQGALPSLLQDGHTPSKPFAEAASQKAPEERKKHAVVFEGPEQKAAREESAAKGEAKVLRTCKRKGTPWHSIGSGSGTSSVLIVSDPEDEDEDQEEEDQESVEAGGKALGEEAASGAGRGLQPKRTSERTSERKATPWVASAEPIQPETAPSDSEEEESTAAATAATAATAAAAAGGLCWWPLAQCCGGVQQQHLSGGEDAEDDRDFSVNYRTAAL